MRSLMTLLLATVPAFGLTFPSEATTQSPVVTSEQRLDIIEQMHDQGYATVLGIEPRQDLVWVETVDQAGPLTVVLNPNSGQVVQSYRTMAADLASEELPVLELSSQRTILDLQQDLDPTLETELQISQETPNIQTVVPSDQRYGASRSPYTNFTLARF